MGEADGPLTIVALGDSTTAVDDWSGQGVEVYPDLLPAALAEADGISRQEATIRAIHEVAARRGHERQVTEASARARARYADVLDRLGR